MMMPGGDKQPIAGKQAYAVAKPPTTRWISKETRHDEVTINKQQHDPAGYYQECFRRCIIEYVRKCKDNWIFPFKYQLSLHFWAERGAFDGETAEKVLLCDTSNEVSGILEIGNTGTCRQSTLASSHRDGPSSLTGQEPGDALEFWFSCWVGKLAFALRPRDATHAVRMKTMDRDSD